MQRSKNSLIAVTKALPKYKKWKMHLKKTEKENVRELNEVTLQAGSSLKEMKWREIEAAFPFYGFSNKNKNQWKILAVLFNVFVLIKSI